MILPVEPFFSCLDQQGFQYLWSSEVKYQFQLTASLLITIKMQDERLKNCASALTSLFPLPHQFISARQLGIMFWFLPLSRMVQSLQFHCIKLLQGSNVPVPLESWNPVFSNPDMVAIIYNFPETIKCLCSIDLKPDNFYITWKQDHHLKTCLGVNRRGFAISNLNQWNWVPLVRGCSQWPSIILDASNSLAVSLHHQSFISKFQFPHIHHSWSPENLKMKPVP